MKATLFALLAGNMLLYAAPASAQDSEASDEIVVNGLRDLNSTSMRGVGKGARESRRLLRDAQRFARCAMERSPENLRKLRRVIDGRTNSSGQALAQLQLIRAHAACTMHPPSTVQFATNASRSNFYDTAYYDRGALFIEAIKAFAPGLKLTEAQTGAPIVQARFDAREVSLARFRLPQDKKYFETAICMVRMRPDIAMRLVRNDGPDTIVDALELELVNKAQPCVGNAKKVYADPAQFRFYVADATYRWLVAASGKDSLVPDP
jgi:hypothetical protein